jgi:hypothetical protein
VKTFRKSLLDSIPAAMSGDMRMAWESLSQVISPISLNGFAAGSVNRTLGLKLLASDSMIHTWAGFEPAFSGAVDCISGTVAAPTVAGGKFVEGELSKDIVFHTGAVPVYTAGDTVWVRAKALAGESVLGWSVPRSVHAFYVTTATLPTPLVFKTVTNIECSIVLTQSPDEQAIYAEMADMDWPTVAGSTDVILASTYGTGTPTNGFSLFDSPNLNRHGYGVIRIFNGNTFDPLTIGSENITIDYTDANDEEQSITVLLENPITLEPFDDRYYFIDTSGRLYLAKDVILAVDSTFHRAMITGPL